MRKNTSIPSTEERMVDQEEAGRLFAKHDFARIGGCQRSARSVYPKKVLEQR